MRRTLRDARGGYRGALTGRALATFAATLALSCNAPVGPPDVAVSTVEEDLTGQNGVLNVTTAKQVVNQYAVLAADIAAGDTSLTITNAGDFTATAPFTTALAAGDLLMIYQPQGATIDATDGSAYGTPGALNGAGRYELVHVASVTGTTIQVETSCGGLAHNYHTAGAAEVIRVPQVTTLAISGTGSLTATTWDGVRGGVLAVSAQTTMTIDGGGIDASATGFRGGSADNTTTGPPGTTTIRATTAASGGEKGESIAGFQAHYDTAFNGRYGRGAPANGGGGGDAHNAGGAGGANGDSGATYTGAGVMDSTVTGGSAWKVDPDFIANGNALTTSSGGGRGGYSFSGSDADAITVGPGSSAWGGDSRRNVGGLGGHPLTNDPTGRLFLGGGGGAGDGNNGAAGPGGAGGGVVFLLADSVGGGGTIQSNGANGGNNASNPGDAPGGAGGGGTIIVRARTLAGVTLRANGGAGGNQTLSAANEAEGPGGGGGGGFIATSGGTVTQAATGSLGGTTNRPTVTEFPTNGATRGADGQANIAITSVGVCTPDDLAITVNDGVASRAPGQTTTYAIVATNNGADVINGATVTDNFPAALTGVTWTCTASAGSTCSVANGTGNISVTVKLAPGGTATFSATGTIDPAATGTLSDTATVAAPAGVTDPTTANNSATDTDQLVASSDLSVAITDSPDPVTVGANETYTVTVTDNGPSNATGVSVVDTLPVGSTFVSATGTGWVCTQSGQTVTCTRAATLPPGAAPPITIIVKAPTTPGTATDTATVSSTTTDPSSPNNSASQSTTVSGSADLSLAITDAPDPVNAGATLTYTATVTNGGPSDATSVTVTDTLPAGVTFVSATGTGWTCTQSGVTVTCTRATATSGAQPPIAIVVTAPATAGTITDTGSVTATTADPNTNNNSATQSTTVNASADLSIAIADSPDPVTAGGTLTYTVSTSNGGPTAAGTTTVTDTLPAGSTFVSATGTGWTCTQTGGVVTCTRTTAAAGAQPPITIVVTAPSAGGTITDTANISSVTADPNPNNNSASQSTTVNASADLSIAITDAPDPVAAGGTLTYTVNAANAGPSVAATVTVTDTLPAGVTFVSATGTGWTCTPSGLVVTCTRATAATGAQPPIAIVVTAPSTAGTITDTATIAATTADPDASNNSASQSTTVSGSADLAIAITDSPDPVTAGGTETYTVTVTNNGPSDATNVTVTDTIPTGSTLTSATGTGWTCTQAGATVTCTRATAPVGTQPPISIVVTAPTAGGTATDTASVTATTADPNPNNNSASQSTTVTGSADLSVAITDAPDPVVAAGTLTYTVTVTNGGPSAASTVTVTDTLPAGTTFVSAAGTGWTCGQAAGVVTCTRATAATGAQPAITIVVTAPTTTGTVSDTVDVTATTADPNPNNNSATATTTVAESADLGITLADAPDPVAAGGTLTYTATVTNAGPSTATSVTVTDTLPAGTTFVSATGTGWTCAASGQTVTCTRATAPVGAQPPIAIVVTAPTNGGTISDTVTVSATTADPKVQNNTATQTTAVTGTADLSIALADAPDPVGAGGALSYTLSVSNAGPSTTGVVTVTDTLPAGVTFVSATGTGWTCTRAGLVVTCTEPNGALGAQAPITIVVTAPAAPTTLTDTAAVSSATADPDTSNNTATATTDVTPSADLAISLADSPDPVVARGTLDYTINVTNLGPSVAANVVVTNTLPAGSLFGSASGTGWTCSQANGVVTCTRAVGAVGALPPIAIITSAPAEGGTVTDTASVSAATADPVSANNTASEDTTVTASADLAISIVASPNPAGTGGTLTYTVTVRNNGSSTATGVTVTETLAPGVTFVSATGTGWSCTAAGQVVTCTAASLPLGDAPPIVITTTAPGTAGSVSNTASVSATTADPNLPNNTATISSDVDAHEADLAVSLGHGDPPGVGGMVVFAMGITNHGPDPAVNLTLVNTLPDGTTLENASSDGWTCDAAGQVVTCTIASLGVGASTNVSLIARAPQVRGSISDSVRVSAQTPDPDLSNNTATTTVFVGATVLADVAIGVTIDQDPVRVGETAVYSISATNLGPDDAGSTTITNIVPQGATIVSVAAVGWDCAQVSILDSPPQAVCKRGQFALGTVAPIQLTVTVPGIVGTMVDSATIEGTATDPDLGNNREDLETAITDAGLGVRGGGCDSSGGGGAGGLVALLGAMAVALRGRVRRLLPVAAAAGALVVAMPAAHAQIAGSPETFSVERMRLSIDGDGVTGVEWASVLKRWEWNVATWIGLADDPLVVYDQKTDQRVESLVAKRFGGALLGAVGVTKWLEIGLEVPLIYDQSNSGIEMLPSPAAPKLGDLRLAPKLLLRRGGPDRTGVALMLGFTVPTGGTSGYAGDDGVTAVPELIVSRAFGAVRLAGNLGYLARPETKFANLDVDDEIFLRLGVGYRFADRETGWKKPLQLDLSYLMATEARTVFDRVNTDVYELDASAGYDVAHDFTLYALGGAGIGAGYGSPDWRVVLGARYTRHGKEVKPRLDRDGDGLYDDEDKCPLEPEDKDGFQDEDGCPDPDNDGDGIPDVADKCPMDPEDKDGFQDDDGCPDPDNDGDGIPDVADKCPMDPEDKDGFQDEDGCPDPDNDADGTLDAQDRCPLEPGPKENEGCPDPDRDGDGVVDRVDNCPDEKGTPENAGCPNKQLVKITGTKLEILESVYFKLDKAVIEPRSFKLLDNVAQVLTGHPTLKIQVEGHTDSQGKPAYNKDLSQRRAAAVVEYLAKKGVDKARLTPIGFGMDKPIADNKTAEGRAQNRRVVFTITSGGDGATIENHQQGAGDDTIEIDPPAPAPTPKK